MRGLVLAGVVYAALDCLRSLCLQVMFATVDRRERVGAENPLSLLWNLATIVGLAVPMLLVVRNARGSDPAGTVRGAVPQVADAASGPRTIPLLAGGSAIAMSVAWVSSGVLAVGCFVLAVFAVSIALGLGLVRASRLVPSACAGVFVGSALSAASLVRAAVVLGNPPGEPRALVCMVAIWTLAAMASVAVLAGAEPVTAMNVVRSRRYLTRVRRDLGGTMGSAVAVAVLCGVVVDLQENVFSFNPGFAVFWFIGPIILALGVIGYAAAGILVDRVNAHLLAATAFVVVCLGQSTAYFSANPGFVVPYAVADSLGFHMLRVVVIAFCFRYATRFRQRDAMPQLGYVVLSACSLVVSGGFEVVRALGPVAFEFAYWLLLLHALAGAAAAGACFVVGQRGGAGTAITAEPAPGGIAAGTGPAALAAAARFHGLTARQTEVLAELVCGRSNQQVADRLVVTVPTAKFHVKNVLAKLGVARRDVPEYVAGFAEDERRPAPLALRRRAASEEATGSVGVGGSMRRVRLR